MLIKNVLSQQTTFEGGELLLTNYRVLWARPGEINSGGECLSLPLRYVIFFEEESPGAFFFGRSKKIVLHLSPADTGNNWFTYFYLIMQTKVLRRMK